MTWVAARTERIHIASNVLNLPLRPPAVTARAAASLDLLTAGRFDLGLGAGGFWDATEAMGGRRLSPGQSIDALDEAIGVIRGIWAADERATLRLDGEYYQVQGQARARARARHPDLDRCFADGTVATASPDENPDLFWAIRGAGANFGIVTSFEFEVDEIGDIGFAQLAFDPSDTAGFFQRWGAAVEAAPREVTSQVILGPPRGGQPPIAQVMVAVDSPDADTVLARLQPLAQIAPLAGSDARITSYAAVMANADTSPHQGQGESVNRSGLIRHITPEFATAIEKLMATGLVYFFQIRSVGGAVADVPPGTTAFANRDANFSVVAFGADRTRLDEAWEDLYPHFSGLYPSFGGGALRELTLTRLAGRSCRPSSVCNAVTSLVSAEFSIVSGGLACIAGALLLTALLTGFRHYGSRSNPAQSATGSLG